MIQTVPRSADRRSRWRRWWWLAIPLVLLMAAVSLVVVATSPKPFDGHTGFVLSVATGELDGTPVVVSGGRDSTIGVWNLATGEPIQGPVNVGEGIPKVLVTELGGVPVIVSGNYDGQVQVWDLATVEPVGEPIGGDEDDELPLDLVGVINLTGAPAAVTLVHSEPDYLQLWDLATGQPVGDPIGANANANLVAATVDHVQGRDVAAALDEVGTAWVWDLIIGELVAEPFPTAATGSLATLELGDLHGTAVVVTGSSGHPDTTISVRNLDTGELIGSPLRSLGYLSSLEVGEVDGSPAIVAGHFDEPYYEDKLIWVWDLASGDQMTEPFGESSRWPWEDDPGYSTLTLTEFDGVPVVVSGDYDTNIRVWDLRTGDLLVGARLRPWDR